MNMKIAKIITWVGLIAMTVGLLNGFINGDFFSDGQLLFQNPWGVMSLIDLYVGFTLFSLWIYYKEESKLIAILWIILMMVLCFFTGFFYVLVGLYRCNNDWTIFFQGKHAIGSGDRNN